MKTKADKVTGGHGDKGTVIDRKRALVSAIVFIEGFLNDESQDGIEELLVGLHSLELPPMSELITWHEVATEMPDAEETVLGFNAQWEDRCWGCYHDGESWRLVEGARLFTAARHGEFQQPSHWAKWPFGPYEKGGAK